MGTISKPARALAAICVVFTLSGYAQPATPRVDYTRQVHPLLASKCLACHSQEKRSGGLSLATYDDVLNGGRSGAAVRPGNSGTSILIQRVTDSGATTRMPLGGPPLKPAEVEILSSWIAEGARKAPTAPPAKPKWEAPLMLTSPKVPSEVWKNWSGSLDRFTASYMAKHGVAVEPAIVSDAVFARRVYLDVQGLLPPPEELRAFLQDRSTGKRKALIENLLADNQKYAEHWISYWNDLLRNDEGVTYYSETAGRKSITEWLLQALLDNLSYKQWVTKLLNPTEPGDPEGFLIGVNWRGVVSASQTPALQAAQNSAQVFLGVNLKCNSCHDSFISKWKLKDAYSLAAFFSSEERLQLYRCDVAQEEYTQAGFLFPELNRPLASMSAADRRVTAAAIFTDSRNGRMPRTLVNRIWQRLMGRGIVEDVDEMDGEPWSPELLDWLAADFAANGYDLKRLIATILESRTYQLHAIARRGEPPKKFTFRGPELRRLSAEQFADAVSSITGEWQTVAGRAPRPASPQLPVSVPPGRYERAWRIPDSSLDRSLGRPIRDQVYSTRDTQATTIQALELSNGEKLTRWLSRGARRMLGQLPPEPVALVARQVNSSPTAPIPFDVDISQSRQLYLIVQDSLSTAPDKAAPVWVRPELIGPNGAVPLSALNPISGGGLRDDGSPTAVLGVPENNIPAVRVKLNSVLVYDIAGKGYTRFRGAPGHEPSGLSQGESVSAQFYVFGEQPAMDRLVRPLPATPLPAGPILTSSQAAVERVYWYALGRAPSLAERKIGIAALTDPARPGKASPEGLADLLWSVLMTPEFQLIR